VRTPGDRVIDGAGYVRIYRAPHVYDVEHRAIAQESLGRPLLSSEDVHHKDGVKTNNDPSNLEVIDHVAHINLHWAKRRSGRKEP